MSDEMAKALQADGDKLLGLTGEDHGPLCQCCFGDGYTVEAGCCNNPLRSGECCGNAIPLQFQCGWCGGTGREPREPRNHDDAEFGMKP